MFRSVSAIRLYLQDFIVTKKTQKIESGTNETLDAFDFDNSVKDGKSKVFIAPEIWRNIRQSATVKRVTFRKANEMTITELLKVLKSKLIRICNDQRDRYEESLQKLCRDVLFENWNENSFVIKYDLIDSKSLQLKYEDCEILLRKRCVSQGRRERYRGLRSNGFQRRARNR